jgi:hypothetical protein
VRLLLLQLRLLLLQLRLLSVAGAGTTALAATAAVIDPAVPVSLDAREC